MIEIDIPGNVDRVFFDFFGFFRDVHIEDFGFTVGRADEIHQDSEDLQAAQFQAPD